MLTQARLRELFDYREDGFLIRKFSYGERIRKGDVVGCPDGDGYLLVNISGKIYKVHRLIWLWHYGYFPENDLDHINRRTNDNRIENLREVSRSCNLRNTGNPKNNTSGVKGVYLNRQTKRWHAQIQLRGRRVVYLGESVCFLEAACLRLAAEQFEGWEGCDSSSPAYKYVTQNIRGVS